MNPCDRQRVLAYVKAICCASVELGIAFSALVDMEVSTKNNESEIPAEIPYFFVICIVIGIISIVFYLLAPECHGEHL